MPTLLILIILALAEMMVINPNTQLSGGNAPVSLETQNTIHWSRIETQGTRHNFLFDTKECDFALYFLRCFAVSTFLAFKQESNFGDRSVKAESCIATLKNICLLLRSCSLSSSQSKWAARKTKVTTTTTSRFSLDLFEPHEIRDFHRLVWHIQHQIVAGSQKCSESYQ